MPRSHRMGGVGGSRTIGILGKQTTFRALFDFTKKGNGALHLGGGLWVSVFDSHQDTTLFPGDHLLKMELKETNHDGYPDLKIDGFILFLGEKDDEVIHTAPVSGEFIYMPAEGAFKRRSLEMLRIHTGEVEADTQTMRTENQRNTEGLKDDRLKK